MTAHAKKDQDLLRTIFDALPSLVFVVDRDVRIQECNMAAAQFLTVGRTAYLKRRAGEMFHCVHANEVPEGCGRAPACKSCIIRNSVTEAIQGKRIVRRRARIEIIQDTQKEELYSLITVSPFSFKGTMQALLVVEDISELVELQRIIPICSVCGKIRDDQESWLKVEAYFKDVWDMDFSHGYCPECYKNEVAKFQKDLSENRGDKDGV